MLASIVTCHMESTPSRVGVRHEPQPGHTAKLQHQWPALTAPGGQHGSGVAQTVTPALVPDSLTKNSSTVTVRVCSDSSAAQAKSSVVYGS